MSSGADYRDRCLGLNPWLETDDEILAAEVLADLEAEFGPIEEPAPTGEVFYQTLSSEVDAHDKHRHHASEKLRSYLSSARTERMRVRIEKEQEKGTQGSALRLPVVSPSSWRTQRAVPPPGRRRDERKDRAPREGHAYRARAGLSRRQRGDKPGSGVRVPSGPHTRPQRETEIVASDA